MAELRIPPSGDQAQHVLHVAGDGRGGRQQAPGQEQDGRQREASSRGGEELAVALAESGRKLAAQLMQDADGQVLIRIVDQARDETVAVVTPEELRQLAEQTGLPAGLLLQAES